MSKRIHELAKEWAVQPRDLVAGLEKLGIRGKRSQSTLTDEEIGRVKEVLGLAPRPTVTVGAERVQGEAIVMVVPPVSVVPPLVPPVVKALT